MDHYQGVAESIEAKRKAQPIASALIDLLYEASRDFDRSAADRQALQIRAIGITGATANTWADITADEACAEMIAAGLAPEGAEPYVVFVAGERVGGFMAKNRYHAANKAKKEYRLDLAEYRRTSAGHEIHGARLGEPDAEQGAALISRIVEQDNAAPVAPAVNAEVAHVAGLDKNGPDSRWPVRATCSCGWVSIWHPTEAKTRAAARSHSEAFGGTVSR